MPSHSPHASRPSTFRAPGRGAPALPSSCCWRSATSLRLAPFSHRSASRIFIRSGSPAAFPHQWSPRMVTTSSIVGRSKPGCGLCPTLSFKDLHHPCCGGGRGKSEPASAWAGDPLLPPASGGGNHPPALWRRHPPAMRGKANCCCLARVQHSVLRPSDCGRMHWGVAQHVVRREGGTRVLGRSRSCFRGENGSEDLPVRFGAAAARWCGVGGQVAAVVGAEVVATGEGFSADDTVNATCAPGLQLFGFNGWFSSPARGCERGPSSGSVRPGAIATAVLPSETEVVVATAVVGGEPPGVCDPAGPPMWRLFIPAGVEPEFRL
jgi:hypothetical protein